MLGCYDMATPSDGLHGINDAIDRSSGRFVIDCIPRGGHRERVRSRECLTVALLELKMQMCNVALG